MRNKSTSKNQIHQIPAGILIGDNRTEIFGCRKTKETFFITNGKTSPFSELDEDKKCQIEQQFLNDKKAVQDLSHLPKNKAIEKFAFCVYGAADYIPDFSEDGILNKADNFICSNNCICLKWKSKSITVDDQPLTSREIQIVTLLASDKCDKQIAFELGISESTLDSHKANIFEKFKMKSKSGVITKAINQKIIQ